MLAVPQHVLCSLLSVACSGDGGGGGDDGSGAVMHAASHSHTISQAKIHPYFPYFHVDVAALVFIFQPVPGAAISECLAFDDADEPCWSV
jgi:hypothetical protein